VGQRSNTETIVALLTAFLKRRTWSQAALAKEIGVNPPTVHKKLVELQANGVPLTSEFDHPHTYWSVPKDWFPGGVLFTSEQVTQVFRLLLRLPAGTARNKLIASILEYLPSRQATAEVVTGESSAREDQHLPAIEDSASQRLALKFRYYTATTGKEATRHASVHRIVYGPPARFVATCHRDGALKWFRVESVSDAKADKHEAFREVDTKLVDAHLRASLDGFHEGGPPVKHVFFVQDPEARWVARNLLEEMRAEDVPGGIRVTLETAALNRLARYVVGLGGAAKPLTPELEAEVTKLAKGALESIRAKADAR
jgi:predicted DNA-binding transcriptional regulator YafY